MRLDPITLITRRKVCIGQGSYAKLTHSKMAEKPKSDSKLYEFVVLIEKSRRQQVMPDDHSKLAPLLPISNRTVKRLSADDSADSRVKVGHRQASNSPKRLT